METDLDEPEDYFQHILEDEPVTGFGPFRRQERLQWFRTGYRQTGKIR